MLAVALDDGACYRYVVSGLLLERDDPPVVWMDDLPERQRRLAEDGLALWRAGRLADARVALDALLVEAEAVGSDDGMVHALHLLGCVAFSEGAFAESRRLHEQVLEMCVMLDFLGGAGSSQFDIGEIDRAEGDFVAARVRYQAAFDAYDAGGYSDRLPIVRSAVESLRS